MLHYDLSDFDITGPNPFQLESNIIQNIMNINGMIEPIILDNNSNQHRNSSQNNQSYHNGSHSPDHHNNSNKKSPMNQNRSQYNMNSSNVSRSRSDNRSFNRGNSSNNNQNTYATRSPNQITNQPYNTRRSQSNNQTSDYEQASTDDGTWERMQEFKATKISKSTEGPDKIIQDIRTCLNKLSSKNYDSQKTLIMQYLQEIQDAEQMPKIAQSIFDVASSNRFYSELYSQLYKELVDIQPLFNELLQPFLQNYMTNIKEIQAFSADDDYDRFCAYNKQNELRKATTVFIVHLMKQGVIPRLRVLSLIISLQDYIVQRVDVEDYTNEIEEMTENLFLFIKESLGQFNDVKTEWMWKYRCIPMIETFSKYKKTDKPSISSRAIFKYMDMMTEIKKAESPKN